MLNLPLCFLKSAIKNQSGDFGTDKIQQSQLLYVLRSWLEYLQDQTKFDMY